MHGALTITLMVPLDSQLSPPDPLVDVKLGQESPSFEEQPGVGAFFCLVLKTTADPTAMSFNQCDTLSTYGFLIDASMFEKATNR